MATTQRSGLPYIWPTWITAFMAGEANCRFRPWFQAHYKYDQREDKSFDLEAWKADHTAAVRRRQEELVREGWKVRVEDQNKFTLKGRTALVGGKPDIVAEREVDIAVDNLSKARREKRKTTLVRVVDCKTGKPKGADWWQVLLYMLAYRLLDESEQPLIFEGEVHYGDHSILVKPEELTQARENDIYSVIKWVAGDLRQKTTPSYAECNRCNIKDCRDRIEAEEEGKEVDVF